MHLLTESEYISLIRKTITDISKEYEGQNQVDEILLWDVITMQIRATSFQYAKKKTPASNRRNKKKMSLHSKENWRKTTPKKKV